MSRTNDVDGGRHMMAGSNKNKGHGCKRAEDDGILDFFWSQIKIGGWGGAAQILVTLVVCLILAFTKPTVPILLWNVFILNIPATIETIVLMQKTPREIPSRNLRRWHLRLLLTMILSIVFAAVLTGVFMNGDGVNASEEVVADYSKYVMFPCEALVLKGCLFLSFMGGILKYTYDILLEESRRRKSNDSATKQSNTP